MWEYDEQDALATATVWTDGGRADAVANMARAFVAMRRERDALLETMRRLTREQAEIVAASTNNANALAAGYRDDCTRALTAQPKVLMYADIKAAGACKDALAEVPTWYPEGFPLTEEAVARLVAHDQSWHDQSWAEWLVRHMAPAPARQEYERVVAAARQEYERVAAPVWQEYDRVVVAARQEYDRVAAPAWQEYERVADPARQEYERVVVAARQAVLIAWGRGDYDAEGTNG